MAKYTVTIELTDEEVDALYAGSYELPEEPLKRDPEFRRAFMTQFVFDELRAIGHHYRELVMDNMVRRKDGRTSDDDMLERLWSNHADLWGRKADEFRLDVED